MTEDREPLIVPLSPLRKAIASRMVEAKRNIPHFRLSRDIEVDALIRLRSEALVTHPGHKLTLSHFLIKACASALVDVPAMNVRWMDDSLCQHYTPDISVIVAVEGGLMCPVVKRANDRSVLEIAETMRDFTERAKRNALKMTEITGGTFSISNLGMYGVDTFDAIINPPQCAILAVGAIKLSVVGSSTSPALQVVRTVRVTLSIDHRALDGVVGASFLGALARRIESPAYMASAPTGGTLA